MNILTSLILILSISACTHHHDHDHSHGHDHKKVYTDYETLTELEFQQALTEERANTQKDYKKLYELISWFEGQTKEHGKAVGTYQKDMAKHKKEMEAASGLAAKKIKLKIGRLREEMQNKHGHHMEDHDQLLSILDDLETLKKELEEHADHHH